MAPEIRRVATAERNARSTVRFPYVPLDGALDLARRLYDSHGGECSFADLATTAGSSPSSSAFRIRLASARAFGLLKSRSGTAALTRLGRAALDPNQQQQALAEAFLNVPLYSLLFEKFEGAVLPPPIGLQKVMQDLGVTAKSAPKARHAFRRSADTAGFFPAGDDRLVNPLTSQFAPADDSSGDANGDSGGENESVELSASSTGSHELPKGPSDPVLKALWSTLPRERFEPGDARNRWLTAFRVVFDMAYPDESNNSGDDAL